MRLNQSRLVAVVFVRYKIISFGSINAGLTYERITVNDANSTNKERVGRDLSFSNDIMELSARRKLSRYNISDVSRKGGDRLDIKSYFFAGIVCSHLNPKAKSDKYNLGQWTEL